MLADAREIYIDGKLVQIPPLPGMIILKLVAWSDRTEDRDQDPGDRLTIIEYYFEYNYDKYMENHNDIFSEGENEQVNI